MIECIPYITLLSILNDKVVIESLTTLETNLIIIFHINFAV
ncbi:protein of unknown function [Clostridium beijerinckii]|nr:protein of unknown function [Clostridium beijerinckii]